MGARPGGPEGGGPECRVFWRPGPKGKLPVLYGQGLGVGMASLGGAGEERPGRGVLRVRPDVTSEGGAYEYSVADPEGENLLLEVWLRTRKGSETCRWPQRGSRTYVCWPGVDVP